MPSVAIEIVDTSPSPVPPELERALVEACAASVRDGTCTLEREPAGDSRNAVAIVRWDSEEHRAHVEVGTKVGDEPRWKSRDLNFGDSDERIERWRTVGLTVATLAGEEFSEAKPNPSEDKVAKTKKSEKSPTPRRVERSEPPSEDRPILWVDVGALAGTGADTVTPRLGVWANVGGRLGRSPLVLFASADYATAESSTSLSVQWAGVAAGIGADASLVGGRFAIEGDLGVGGDRIHASASDPTRKDSDALFEFGGRGRVSLVYRLGFLSPVLGAEGWLNTGRLQILVHERDAGTVAQLGGAVVLGVRARVR